MADLRIAITGLSNSGKSAFLTSLLWQLVEFADADFLFGQNAKVEAFRELRKSSNGATAFPFDRYRDALQRSGRWPDKTKDCYQYSCVFTRSDWRGFSMGRLSRLKFGRKQRVEFLDFPGERIADAAIAAYDDYEVWSDHILDHMASHSDYSDVAQPYMDLLAGAELDKEVVLRTYRETLGALILSYKPLITPSVFLLDTLGQPASGSNASMLADSQIVGLDSESQFSPLSRKAREKAPELAKSMAKHYRRYRRELALPLFKSIGQSNRLIVCVDIPSLLMGGVGRYNDNREVLHHLFDALRPDSIIGDMLWRLLTFWRGRIRRVAFVATKADLVHPSDHESGRLESLLRQMTARAKTLLEDVEFGWFVCSACRSTRPGSVDHSLIGRLKNQAVDGPETEFKVSALPETWPNDWSAGEYRFSQVRPIVAKNLQIPPDHIGLDRVFDFLSK